MKKVAFFVEGQTEALFAKRLLLEIANKNDVVFEVLDLSSNQIITLSGGRKVRNEQFYALICNCGNDSTVKSKILSNAESLSKAGYSKIVGLNDLRPRRLEDLPLYQAQLPQGLEALALPTEIIIAVRETEAWFISEWHHFENIHAKLTPNRIKNHLGFDVRSDDARTLEDPPKFLNQAYKIFNKTYKKKRSHVNQLLNALDFEHLYLDVTKRVPELRQLVEAIDNLF